MSNDKMTKLKIVVLGPPGSGKGTHSKILSRHFKIPIISAGELLRKEARTKRGKQIRRIINAGKLVPNSIINDLIKKKIKRVKGGAIIEGYPRDLEALDLLKKYFVPDIVIILNISKKETLKRLSNRWLCENCNETYSLYNKPKKKGFCDTCGKKLIQRSDDMPKAIRARLSIFEKKTKPVIRHFKKRGLVLEIEGDARSIKEVSKDITQKIKDKM